MHYQCLMCEGADQPIFATSGSFCHHAEKVHPHVHSGNWKYRELTVQEASGIITKPLRTQKAKGIAHLTACGVLNPENVVFVTVPDQLAWYDKHGLPFKPCFCRPCPTTPRHGFVDSRTVADSAELRKVWNEAKAADPDAELVLMKTIDAALSAILTPNAVVVGRGNDGATSGKEGAITFPLAAVNMCGLGIRNPDYTAPEIGIHDTPFVESVYSKQGHTSIVQLRDGPRPVSVMGDGSAYITKDCTVAHVIELAQGSAPDLLDWEQTMHNAPDGTAVYMPGGNMLSHYAIHAVQRGFPIVFRGDVPKVGNTLTANVVKPEPNIEAVRKGITVGLNCEITDNEWTTLLRVVFFGTHQSNALLTSEAGCQAIGIAAALFARFGTAGCLGEWRHGRKSQLRNLDRCQVYRNAFRDYFGSRDMLRKAFRAFDRNSWPSGYGGKAWANCTRNTIALDCCLYDVLEHGRQEDITALIEQLNVNVNLAHNGGWWLNKFTNQSTMDAQSEGVAKDILKAVYAIAPLIESAKGFMSVRFDKRIKLPLAPAPMFQLRGFTASSGETKLTLQFGTPNSYGWDTYKPGAKEGATIIEFLTALAPKRFKSFEAGSGSMYHRPTKAFWAAIEIAAPVAYNVMRGWIANKTNVKG